jgi:peptidyl-prolyl cis-trans isomerase D
MLDKIRSFAGIKIVRYLFAIFLIIPFGLFGIDYYFRAPIGGDTVATVGNQRISAVDFDQALRQQQDQYTQQFGRSFDASFMDNPEIRKSVLDRAINERLISQGAERAGVRVSNDVLGQRIANEPLFQENGKFSKARFDQIARMQGVTPVGLEERLREDFRTQRFRDAIMATAIVPRSTLDGFVRLSEQGREVSVVNLGPEAYLAQVKFAPEQLRAYYDAHVAEFAVPEQVRVEFIELSVDALAAQAKADPEEVRKFYEANQARYMRKEERRASHILIALKPDATDADKKAAEARARKIFEDLKKNPASFAEVAKKESQDPGSAVQGGDLGFFGREAMVKPFADAAFEAKKGETVGPVLSDFGYHVIRVVDVKPASGKSLAEASPEIEADLRKQTAALKFGEGAESFSNAVYENPASLKTAADSLKLPIRQSGWFGKAFGAQPPLNSPKIAAEIFSDNAIKAKRNTAAVEVAPNVLVSARVIEHKPAETRSFESVQAAIEQRLKRDEAMKLAQADGDAKLKALAEGKSAGLAWPAVLVVNRQKPGGLAPPVIERIFRVDAKAPPVFVGVATPSGFALVRVSKVVEPAAIDDAKRAGLADQLRQTVAVSELEASLGMLKQKIGVNVRKDALEKKAPAQ